MDKERKVITQETERDFSVFRTPKNVLIVADSPEISAVLSLVSDALHLSKSQKRDLATYGNTVKLAALLGHIKDTVLQAKRLREAWRDLQTHYEELAQGDLFAGQTTRRDDRGRIEV